MIYSMTTVTERFRLCVNGSRTNKVASLSPKTLYHLELRPLLSPNRTCVLCQGFGEPLNTWEVNQLKLK